MNKGKLYVVATPIGNLNDFSKRAIETLRNSNLILVEDTRQTIKLLNSFNIKVKMESYHKYNEEKKKNEIIEKLNNGEIISLVSDAGTPCISDPGYILVKECRENDIDVIGIPGCSAIIDALSISGLDTSSFSFYGFLPLTNKDRKKIFEDIRNSNIKTKVIYESPKRLFSLVKEIKEEIPNCKVSILSELTKIHEKCIYGNIEKVLNQIENIKDEIKGEFVVLISNEPEIKDKVSYEIESLLIDKIIKNNCTLKEAINLLNSENDNISKKDIYNASLNLKNILKENIK